MVLVEYSHMMQKFLEYLNNLTKGDDPNEASSDKPSIQQGLLNQLIPRLNSRWYTLAYLTLIHASMLTFNTSLVCLLDSSIFIVICMVKLYKYSDFMDSQHR